MKRLIKKSLLTCLSVLGVLDFMHYRNRNKVTVLMLHGVMAKHDKVSWDPLRAQLSPNELQRILQILSHHYQFITTDQCVAMLEGKMAVVNNPLLITFDDGYRNNLDYALPICEQFAIKPILFVATSHVDSGLPFWFDRLDYALQQNMGEFISLTYQGNAYNFDARSRDALRVSFKKFRDHCKQVFSDDITMNQLFDALSEMLEARSGKALRDICVNDDWSGIVSWSQLRDAVAKNRLDVGCHSVDHWRMDRLSKEQICSQLTQSKTKIESELAHKCHYFCYPNGNYNELTIKLLKQSGYKAAFTTDLGLCEVNCDLMKLKRFSFPTGKTKEQIIYRFNRYF